MVIYHGRKKQTWPFFIWGSHGKFLLSRSHAEFPKGFRDVSHHLHLVASARNVGRIRNPPSSEQHLAPECAEKCSAARNFCRICSALLRYCRKPHKGFLPAMVTPVQALILHFLHNLTGCGRQHHHLPHHLDDLQEEMQLQRFAASCAVLAYFQQVLIPIELSAPRQWSGTIWAR